MVRCTGGDRDFATIVRGALADGWDQRCMIFDLPRVSEGHAIYGPIEACKDGVVTATKYEGGTIAFDPPHVLVFANYLPNTEGTLSADRWRIHRVKSDKTLDKPIFGRTAESRTSGPIHGALNINRAPGVAGDILKELASGRERIAVPVREKRDNVAVDESPFDLLAELM